MDLRKTETISTDKESDVNVVQSLGFDGSDSLQREIADSVAVKTQTVGDVTYVCRASPGTSQATAKWQCMKVDTTSGVVITWAGGSPNFDQVATDPSSLTYS